MLDRGDKHTPVRNLSTPDCNQTNASDKWSFLRPDRDDSNLELWHDPISSAIATLKNQRILISNRAWFKLLYIRHQLLEAVL